MTVAASSSIVEPISPELVLVDPALRQAVLSAMQREFERASRASENRADDFRHPVESAPLSGSPQASLEKAKTELETEGAAPAVRAKVGSPQWWAAVVLYSFVIVALVLICSYLSRLV